MKRATALRNAQRIRDRLKGLGGLVGTPACEHEAVLIKRAWVFGSTVKGSDSPGDLDILIEYANVGERRNARSGKVRLKDWICNLKTPVRSVDEAIIFLRAGMKKVSVHLYENDGDLGDVPQTRQMIYPRCDFNFE